MKRTYPICLVSLLLCIIGCLVPAPTSAGGVGLGIDVGCYSADVDTSGWMIYPRTDIQATVRVAHEPTGLYGTYFGFLSPSTGLWADEGDEHDLQLGIMREVGGFSIDLGAKYFALVGDADLVSVIASIARPLGPATTASLLLEHRWGTNPAVLPGGTLWQFEIDQKVGSRLDFKLDLGGHGGLYGETPQALAFVRGIATIQLTSGPVVVSAGAAIQRCVGHVLSPIARNSEWVFVSAHWDSPQPAK